MAQYTIDHTCGHTSRQNIIGPSSSRKRRIEWLETTLCNDCYKEKMDAERAAVNAASLQTSIELDLPPLTGSEKNVQWATTIRLQWLQHVTQKHDTYSILHSLSAVGIDHRAIVKRAEGDPNASIENLYSSSVVVLEAIEPLLYEWAGSKTEARFWSRRFEHISEESQEELKGPATSIFNAWLNGGDIATAAAESDKRAQQERAEAEEKRQLETQRAIAATVLAEQPKSKLVARFVESDKGTLRVRFEERIDDFRAIMKMLQYNWDADVKVWQKATDNRQELIIETAHKLLAGGFNVRVYDDEARRRAISGEYLPDNPRKISASNGKFTVLWPFGSDFYSAAKRIHGARYSKPVVLVPAESYEEVLDFAQRYNFQVLGPAELLVNNQKAALERMMTVSVDQPNAEESPAYSEKPKPLEVPEIVGIAPSLVDEL
jgi:hypothetical protein